MQNLHETYLNLSDQKNETENLITQILENTKIFNREDSNVIANTIVKEGLIDVFLEDTLDFYNMIEVIDESTIPVNSRINTLELLSDIVLDEEYLEEISKGLLKRALSNFGGRLKKVPDNLKGVPARTLINRGYSVPGQVNVRGVRDTSNRNASARASLDSPKGRSVSSVRTQREKARKGAEGVGRRRGETVGNGGKYLNMLRDKRANAPSSSAIVPSTRSAIQKGWDRHDAAIGSAGKGALNAALVAGLMSGVLPVGKLASTAAKKAAPNVVSSSGISNVLRSRMAARPNVKSAEKGGAIVPTNNTKGALSRKNVPVYDKEPPINVNPTKGSLPPGKRSSSQADDARQWQRYQDSARRTGSAAPTPPQGPGPAPKPQWGDDAAKSTGPSKRPRMANRGAASEPSPISTGVAGTRGNGSSNTQTGGSGSPRGNDTAASVRRARAQAKADAAARGQGPSGSAIPMGGSSNTQTGGSGSPRGNVTAASVRRARAQAKADAAARGQGPSGSAIPMGGSGPARSQGSQRRKIAGLAAAGAGAGLLGASLLGGDEKKKENRSGSTPGTNLGELEPPTKPTPSVPSRRPSTGSSSKSNEPISSQFDKAFSAARKKQGRYGEFGFRGKKYHTQYDYEKGVKESVEFDVFDVIFEHLLIEGYANTPKEALEIMEHMSLGEVQEVLDTYYS